MFKIDAFGYHAKTSLSVVRSFLVFLYMKTETKLFLEMQRKIPPNRTQRQ